MDTPHFETNSTIAQRSLVTFNTFNNSFKQAVRRLFSQYLPELFEGWSMPLLAAGCREIGKQEHFGLDNCAEIAVHFSEPVTRSCVSVMDAAITVLTDFVSFKMWGCYYCNPDQVTRAMSAIMDLAAVAAFRKNGGKECWCGCEFAGNEEEARRVDKLMEEAFEHERGLQLADLETETSRLTARLEQKDPHIDDIKNAERHVKISVPQRSRAGRRVGSLQELMAMLGSQGRSQSAEVDVAVVPDEIMQEMLSPDTSTSSEEEEEEEATKEKV